MTATRASLALAMLVGAVPVTASAAVGPGPDSTVVRNGKNRVSLSISPNHGGLVDNTFTVRWTQGARRVHGTVRAVFTMQEMAMPSLRLALRRGSDGVYRGTGRMLTMPGRWEIRLRLRERGPPTEVAVVDHVTLGFD